MRVRQAATRFPSPWNVAAAVLILLYCCGVALLCRAAVLTFPSPRTSRPVLLDVFEDFGDPTAWWPVAAVVLIGLAAFVTFLYPRRSEERSFWFYLAAGLGGSTVALAMAGSWNCSNGQVPGFAALSVAAGLLVGNAPSLAGACENVPWPPALQLAAILGPALIVLAAVKIVVTLFRTQYHRLLVRYAPALIVVVGLSDDVIPLLRRLSSEAGPRGKLAVFVEEAPEALVRQARTIGARVVEASPDLPSMQHLLLHQGRFKVRTLYVIGSDASANLDWARLFRDVADASRTHTTEAAPKIIVRLDDPWQAEYWRRTNAYRTPTAGRAQAVRWVSDALSVHEVTAAILVHHVQAGDHDRLVLVGQTPLALAICAELAQREREDTVLRESSRPSFDDLILVGRQAEEMLRQHQIRQERFGNVAAGDAFAVVDAEPSAATFAELLGSAQRPAVIFSAALTETGDPALSATLLAALHPTWTIYEPDPLTRGLATRPIMEQLYSYGPTIEPPQGWPVDSWERAARIVHQRFVKSMGSALNPAKPSHRPWEQLTTFYRESNVRLVTATLAGAEAVGRTWGPVAAEGRGVSLTVSREHLVGMARWEHDSWRRFYSDNGWRYGTERDDRRHVHNALLPWEELSDYFRDLTIDTVRSALSTLDALGYRSSAESDRPWQRYLRSGEVTAEVLASAWSWTTAGGDTLHAQAGDVRVTGDDGDTWSVDPVVFHQTYERIEGNRWRRVGTVEAQPAEDGELVLSLEGPETARAGDWIVRGPGGDLWVTSAEHFQRNYTPV